MTQITISIHEHNLDEAETCYAIKIRPGNGWFSHRERMYDRLLGWCKTHWDDPDSWTFGGLNGDELWVGTFAQAMEFKLYWDGVAVKEANAK